MTELFGSIATLEFCNGSVRRTRLNTRASLEDPNDNAVAQARWISTRVGGLEIPPSAFNIITSYEARCWRAMHDGNWSVALTEACAWLLDEPFASRPAVRESFIATALMDKLDLAESFTRIGLRADPTNSMLLNNLAVVLLRKNNVKEGVDVFNRIPAQFSDDHPEFVHLATRGLMSFRSRQSEDGRQQYERATRLALSWTKKLVLAHWVREELEADPRCATRAVELCQDICGSTKDPVTRRVAELLHQRATQVASLIFGSQGVSLAGPIAGNALPQIAKIAADASIKEN